MAVLFRLMVRYTRVVGIQIRAVDLVFLQLPTDTDMKENGMQISEKVMVKNSGRTGLTSKDNSQRAKRMVMEDLTGPMDLFIKVVLKIIYSTGMGSIILLI